MAYVPCALAAKQATRDIPIVIIAADPVETGIVPSLARPGGNITGVSLMSAASNAKNIELFRDMLPSVRRVGVLANAKDPVFAKTMIDEVLRAGGATSIEIQPVVMIHGPDELESAFMAMVREQAGAVIVQGSLVIKSLADMAIKYRLPAASSTRAFADMRLQYFEQRGGESFSPLGFCYANRAIEVTVGLRREGAQHGLDDRHMRFCRE